MKDRLLKLNELLTRLSPDLFYVISIHADSISIQGRYSSAAIRALSKVGIPQSSFSIKLNSHYLTAHVDNIDVTLTD